MLLVVTPKLFLLGPGPSTTIFLNQVRTAEGRVRLVFLKLLWFARQYVSVCLPQGINNQWHD